MDTDQDNDIDEENLESPEPKRKSHSRKTRKRCTRPRGSESPEAFRALASNEDQHREPPRHPRPNTLLLHGQIHGGPSTGLPGTSHGKHGRNNQHVNKFHDMQRVERDNSPASRRRCQAEGSSSMEDRSRRKSPMRRPKGWKSAEGSSPRLAQRHGTQGSPRPAPKLGQMRRTERPHRNSPRNVDFNNSDDTRDQLSLGASGCSSDNGSSLIQNSQSAHNSPRNAFLRPPVNTASGQSPSVTVVIAESMSDLDTPRVLRKDVATEITPGIDQPFLHPENANDRPLRRHPNEPHVVQVGGQAALSPLSDDLDNGPSVGKGVYSGGTGESSIYDEPPPEYSTVDRRHDIIPGPNYGYSGQSVMFTDPPPSYRDLFHESVRQTVNRLSSNNTSTGFFANSTCGRALCTAIFVIGVIGFAVVLPIAMIGVGVHHLYDCPAEPRIPIYLIVAAVFQMMECCGRLTYYAQEQRNPSNRRKHRDPCIYFVLIWFVIGSIWVYQTSPVFVDQQTVYIKNSTSDLSQMQVATLAPSHTQDGFLNHYCHQTLYLFAFWLVTIYYLAIGFFFTMIIISIFVHTMVTFCRRLINYSTRARDSPERV